jgi:hypothetical protein
MHQIEKSSRFKSGEYGGKSGGTQKSANNCWVVLAMWAGTESAEKHIFHHVGPGDHMLSQKFLVNVSVDPFTGRNRHSAAKICKTCSHSACIALSALSPWHQIHAIA